jgi:hypothetical protein
MLGSILYIIRQKGIKCISLGIGISILFNASANDGKQLSTPRPLVPVNNYQWFMIGVATTYTMCLIVRARRRRTRRKANDQI